MHKNKVTLLVVSLMTTMILLLTHFSLEQSSALQTRAKAQESSFTFNEFLIETPHVTLPFHLIDGMPVIDGAVNGIEGKFLFDTGTHFPFFLNNNRLPLSKDTFLAQGTTASGQELVLYLQDQPIESVELANQLRFEKLQSLPHTNWSFVEHGLVEGFLGTIGYGFNRNYMFVINYDVQTLDLYRLNQDRGALASYLDSDRVVATLNFIPTNDEGNIPAVQFTIGNAPILGVFDTGDHGTLTLTKRLKTRLEQQGYLITDHQDFLYGTYEPYVRASLKGLKYGDKSLVEIHNLRLEIGEENRLMLGYQFLKNYVTAWNYQDQTIKLLMR